MSFDVRSCSLRHNRLPLPLFLLLILVILSVQVVLSGGGGSSRRLGVVGGGAPVARCCFKPMDSARDRLGIFGGPEAHCPVAVGGWRSLGRWYTFAIDIAGKSPGIISSCRGFSCCCRLVRGGFSISAADSGDSLPPCPPWLERIERWLAGDAFGDV